MRQYLKHPLAIIVIVSLVAAFIALAMAAARGNDEVVNFLTNAIVFLATGLTSYVITHFNERDQFRTELAKLSDFSKRRVQLLSENLSSLNEEIADISNVDEVKRLVSYTLTNMSQDAAASVEDIREIGGGEKNNTAITHEDVTYPPQLVVPAEPAPVLPKVIPSEQDLTYSCPTCGHSNLATLSLATGQTKQVMCSQCDSVMNLHRLGDGGFRVVSKNPRRLSYYSLAAQMKAALPPEPSEHAHFDCPRCKNTISYRVDRTASKVEKACFSCLAVVLLDQGTGVATLEHGRLPLYVPTIHSASMTCQNCGGIFEPRIYRTGPNREFTCCFRCNTIYLEKRDQKIIIRKACASPGCSNHIAFSIRETQDEARQFCFECMTRQKYEAEKDLVTVIETLSVPKVSVRDVTAAGVECPHCGQLASGRTTANSRRQRLSICWNCKNVFELIQDVPSDMTAPNVSQLIPRQ